MSQLDHSIITQLCITAADISHLPDLMIALNYITSEWFDLGLHLRVKYSTLKAIEADYRKVKQCMREMLAVWLKGQGGECTKHTLRTAMLNIGDD